MRNIIIVITALCLYGCMPNVIRVVDVTHSQIRELEMQNAALKAANEYLCEQSKICPKH